MLRVLYPLACASDRLRVLNFGRCKRLTPSPASFRMKVYTRTGDAGQTSLFNGRRVPKNDSRVEAYGTVDECNAAVGMACAHLSMRDVAAVGEYSADTEAALEGLRSRLESLQHRLFDLGAHLATPRDTSTQTKLDKTAFPSKPGSMTWRPLYPHSRHLYCPGVTRLLPRCTLREQLPVAQRGP
jgi:hypothetical protein